MEENLLEKGMAQAATAFFAQRAFNAPMEHARYLSLNDLLAMTAMQYEHAGIAPLWPLIESALLTPEREDKADGVEGRGFFLWPDKAVPALPVKPYAFNWSYDFLIRSE